MTLEVKEIQESAEKLQDPIDRLNNAPVCFDYDDVLLRPCLSEVPSRRDVSLATEMIPCLEFENPIMAAPMSTICESKMCVKMYECGGLGILHRFADDDYILAELKKVREIVPQERTAFAIGIKEQDKELLAMLAPLAGIVCVDVNIGHHVRTVAMVKHIKENYPHLKIIAGNVSTYEGARDLCEAGANCIRATNGGGSACTTLAATGVGLPTLSSLAECIRAAEEYGATVIADGGHKNASSMTKAMALGASSVMIGGLLAGSSACPTHAFFLDEKGNYRAKYFGMASKEAQRKRGSGIKKGTAPEGISKTVSLKGKTRVIIEELCGGMRSGLTFCNARNFKELKKNAQFVRVTGASILRLSQK